MKKFEVAKIDNNLVLAEIFQLEESLTKFLGKNVALVLYEEKEEIKGKDDEQQETYSEVR